MCFIARFGVDSCFCLLGLSWRVVGGCQVLPEVVICREQWVSRGLVRNLGMNVWVWADGGVWMPKWVHLDV